jgi:hypothetical protein
MRYRIFSATIHHPLNIITARYWPRAKLDFILNNNNVTQASIQVYSIVIIKATDERHHRDQPPLIAGSAVRLTITIYVLLNR